ncbi:hypothetical protein HI914_00944 [Erysiphe necator]|nr:hypothetical protein HI914_00944 [Erysiphe necator]
MYLQTNWGTKENPAMVQYVSKTVLLEREQRVGTFGNLSEKNNARILLSVLNQGNDESFSGFVPKFEELLGRVEWGRVAAKRSCRHSGRYT